MRDTNRIELNGRIYVAEDSLPAPQPVALEDTVMVRSESAGVFYGTPVEINLAEGWVKMKNARRVWYWDGAASLSQLATEGTSKPKGCKFPIAVPEITVGKVIEIIPMTKQAIESLNSVQVWKS
jgi:hypothetical protein